MSEKRLCPECDNENTLDAEKCSKCGLDLPAFSQLDRLLTAREKRAQREQEQREKDEREKKDKDKQGKASFTDTLLGRGKK